MGAQSSFPRSRFTAMPTTSAWSKASGRRCPSASRSSTGPPVSPAQGTRTVAITASSRAVDARNRAGSTRA